LHDSLQCAFVCLRLKMTPIHQLSHTPRLSVVLPDNLYHLKNAGYLPIEPLITDFPTFIRGNPPNPRHPRSILKCPRKTGHENGKSKQDFPT